MSLFFKINALLFILLTPFVHANELFAGSGYAADSLVKCNTHLKRLNHVIGWQVEWPRQWQAIVEKGPKNIGDSLEKWKGFEAAVSQAIDELKRGLNGTEVAPYVVASNVRQQVVDLLSILREPKSPMLFRGSNDKQAQLWNGFVENSIVPSVSKFEHFLTKHYLPKASQYSGLYGAPDNKECFYSAVEWWTSLKPSQDEIERIGKHYLNSSRDMLAKTSKKNESFGDLKLRLNRRVENGDINRKDIISISESAIENAFSKISTAFLYAIERNLVVSEMSPHIRESAPAGYYQGAQGRIPAQYIINTSRPNDRRLMAEVLAFHEGVPGHYLWDAYPRKDAEQGYNSGLLEGWAIYAEFLADDLNLYSSTFDRQGMMAKHLWAASRLIVEPGLHLKGWSRDSAVKFMLDNTFLSKREVEIEVDRYIAMPGQSLGYILGANLILSERARAKSVLGEAFDLAQFHDVILHKGVRTLPQVRNDIRSWVKSISEKSE